MLSIHASRLARRGLTRVPGAGFPARAVQRCARMVPTENTAHATRVLDCPFPCARLGAHSGPTSCRSTAAVPRRQLRVSRIALCKKEGTDDKSERGFARRFVCPLGPCPPRVHAPWWRADDCAAGARRRGQQCCPGQRVRAPARALARSHKTNDQTALCSAPSLPSSSHASVAGRRVLTCPAWRQR